MTDEIQPEEGTYGAQFLHHWRSRGGPLSNSSYAQLQAIKAGGREQVRAVFGSEFSMSYQFNQLLETCTPQVATTEILLLVRLMRAGISRRGY
ncbi:MAG: hypothetical protein ACI841_000091 [Planctomycetota bacterium]|jgi:hypothetical protein